MRTLTSKLITSIVNSDDGTRNYEVTRTLEGVEGDKAIVLTLYPSYSGQDLFRMDSTALHMTNHLMNDLQISTVKVINLFSKYLNIPVQDRRKIASPEKLCGYIHDEMESRYVFGDIKGRTLRDYYEKYMREYSLEVVLSKVEIVRLFLYYYPYPECSREKATSLKVAKHWKAAELAEDLRVSWGYDYSVSTCNKVLKEFYHLSVPLASVQPLKKRSQRNVAVLEWAFVEAERKGRRLKNYLPRYKFVCNTHAYQKPLIILSYSEADCVLLDEWVMEVERAVKTLIEDWGIRHVLRIILQLFFFAVRFAVKREEKFRQTLYFATIDLA